MDQSLQSGRRESPLLDIRFAFFLDWKIKIFPVRRLDGRFVEFKH